MNNKTKAIALISGGLDSLLAARVIMDQGIEVLGIAFVMTAATTSAEQTAQGIEEASAEAGIPVRVIDISREFLDIVRKPKHGYGANVNPCIDCKIFMMRKAKKIMEEEGASFMITGEVLGERPMSQNKKSLDLIKGESTVDERLIRPLSAKLLEETLPEKEGLVDRKRLLDIEGRSRKPQLELAKKYGITKYSPPGASCLLTDPGFSRRVKDLLDHDALTMEEMDLLKVGRHFRLDEKTKAVVGRNEQENQALRDLKKDTDVLVRLDKIPGPDVLLRGELSKKNKELAAELAVFHSKAKEEKGVEVSVWSGHKEKESMTANPLKKGDAEAMRV